MYGGASEVCIESMQIYTLGPMLPACAGGYFEEARMLAQVSGLHSKTVDICLNHIAGDIGGAEALNYIRSLRRVEQEQLLQQYGKALISKFKLEMEVCLYHGCCLWNMKHSQHVYLRPSTPRFHCWSLSGPSVVLKLLVLCPLTRARWVVQELGASLPVKACLGREAR